MNGLWPLTHVGEYQGDIVAANILGEEREANYEAIPLWSTPTRRRPRWAPPSPVQRDRSSVRGAQDRDLHTRVREFHGFLTLLSDGERLTGAYALGPEAGEWLQQAVLAVRARCR